MRRLLVLTAVLAFGFTLPGVAVGYWLAAGSAGSARASAASLPAGPTPIAVVRAGNSIRITLRSTGVAVDDYLLRRYPAGRDRAVISFRCRASCVENAVADGRWVYTATPELAAWSGSESPASRAVRVDTTPPVLSVTSPTATDDRTPELTGRAGVTPGDAHVVAVRVLAGSHLVLLRNVAVVAGRWRLRVGPLSPQHSYTVLVRQRDEAGNLGSARSAFVLDTLAPAPTLAPVSWPAFAGKAGHTGASATTSADGAEVDVQIFAAGRLVRTLPTTRTAGRWTVTGAGLPSGTYTARAVQRDGAGNIGYSAKRSFTVDATPPAVSVDVPAYFNVINPVVSGQVGVSDGDRPNVQVRILAQGIEVQRRTVAAHGQSWSVRLSPLTGNQRYQVLVTQSDRAGNVGSATASFVLDVSAPVVTAALTDGVLTGTAGTVPAGDTASPDAPSVQVLIRSGHRQVASIDEPVTDGSFSLTLPPLEPGRYTVVVQQSDAAGNVGCSQVIVLSVPPAS